jgi:hypothetical protein
VEFKLSNEDKEIFELFNQKADQVINSSFIHEAKTKDIGFTLSGKVGNKPDEWNWSYDVKGHDMDFINSVVLPIRFFIQDNERISLRNMYTLYTNLPLHDNYKITFNDIRNYLNEYLDEKARSFLDDQPTKRELLETIVYGELAHLNPEKVERLKNWKNDKMEWDLAFFEFQRVIHELIEMIKLIRNVNSFVLKRYG